MNLLSVLHVERAYKLKKKFSVFFSQFVAKKEVISTLLTWISSVLRKAAIFPLNLQIRVLQISTARIDGWYSVPNFPKVNNLCINTHWIQVQCSCCCCYRWTLNYRVTCRRGNLSDSTARALSNFCLFVAAMTVSIKTKWLLRQQQEICSFIISVLIAYLLFQFLF